MAEGRFPFLRLIGAFIWLGLAPILSAQAPTSVKALRDLSVSPSFFNPSLGQRVTFSLSLAAPGSLTLGVIDRDGFEIRSLASGTVLSKGTHSFEWDGRNERGEVVADEAYSVKADLKKEGATETYFPVNAPAEELRTGITYYDRQSGVIAYELKRPGRVHMQAGSSRRDPKSGQALGPVLKTIVNREPRIGGRIIENWNGLDESGTIRVFDLPDFVLAVAVTALPEDSVITVGNKATTYLQTVQKREGRSLLTFSVPKHAHHQGLTALEDKAPELRLVPKEASWLSTERLWRVQSGLLRLTASLEGPSAPYFARQPGRVVVFLDQKHFREIAMNPSDRSDFEISIPISGLSRGPHHATVNWVSEYGPVAVNSVRFAVAIEPVAGTARRSARKGGKTR